MKKTLIIATMLSCLFVFGCTKHGGTENRGFFYDNILTVKGVFQDVENNVMAEEGTLVLDGYFDDHADHIYLPKGMREEYLKSENDYLPGNKIKFMGDLKEIDAGAGNHYYEVVDIYKLEIKGYPNKGEIESIIDSYSYCETASDCIELNPECSFGCPVSVNATYKDISSKIIRNYTKLNDKTSCKNDCKSTLDISCETNKCTIITERPMIDCTEEDRAVQECSSDFEPVCGSDGVGYNNPCLACQSQYVGSYSIGGCKNISYFIKGTPKNLNYVVGFINKNGSVSCDMTYNFKGENLKGKIIADKDRFFALRDIYYGGHVYHDYYLLSVNGKRYERIEALPEIMNKFNFSFLVKDEIEGVLIATEVFDNFNIECNAGIDDESVFVVPNYPEFTSDE